ncbi:MAG: M24 family metallopeptidase, partial [Phycisphaerae bacterium]|nr:aminopeptidase P family protein [Gammaproteobacteria bacterium]NIR48662.1 aminopeptidase P family protein [candidate division KSB1 bacterium]NIV00715.1 M24 family metallopeptidase [Phycisphaerae bacterium]NIQ09917.1 aminopeptidase P family protein [Gammaproteobacteria bacterium]NIS24204.1 aminopeptidase P family protein [candidate division KSB1 bacterium]
MRITPAVELKNRIEKLQNEMFVHSLDAVLLLQNADLFYFTGSIQQGALYVPVEGEALYLVRKDHGRARMESGLKEVLPFKSPRDIPDLLNDFKLKIPENLGMELDVLPVSVMNRFAKVLSKSDVKDATPLIRNVRAVKSDYEIGILKDAALIVDKVCKRAKEVIKEGMTDLELAAELEFTARKAGHQGLVRMRGFNNELFYAHVFSGTDSAVPTYSDTPLGGVGLNPSFPQGASYKKIARNEPITVDFSGIFDGYIVDQTRMFSIGELPEQLTKAYEDMVAIQEHAKQIARPGATWGGVYDDCLQMANDLGYGESFMGAKGAQVSFIGHGVGVELDEYPFIARGFNDYEL